MSEVFSHKWDIYTAHRHPKAQDNIEEKAVRRQDWSTTVSSSSNRTWVLMNSQQLWLPEQYLHKIKPVSIMVEQERVHNSPPLTKELWTHEGS